MTIINKIKWWKLLFLIIASPFLSPALAASGGQLPLSTLEGGSKVMLGSSGGQGGGLPSSLFLNHPTLLHMGQNPGVGLVSAAIAKVSQPSHFPSASSISPTPCSPSPCSSPASSCSSSEMAHSPSSLGAPKIEWPQLGVNQRGAERIKEEPRLSHQSYLFLSLVLFFRFCYRFVFSRHLSPSFSPSLSMPKIYRMKEERRRERSKRREKEEKDWNQKSLCIQSDETETAMDIFL